jgi:hypothetical protein
MPYRRANARPKAPFWSLLALKRSAIKLQSEKFHLQIRSIRAD